MIYAYLRVSTDDQAESGLGLDAQLEAITKTYGTPDKVYRDEGFSGADPKRPGLIDALDALRHGDALAVAKRDRLARDVMLSGWIRKEVSKHGAEILSAAGEGTGADDPASVLMGQIIDAFAEYERGVIATRTKSAMDQKRQRGEYLGGKVPFGYQLDESGRYLVDDPDEQRVIALIGDLRLDGLSLRQIGRELESRGIFGYIPTEVRRLS